jgi:acetoacetyl-CoA reductase
MPRVAVVTGGTRGIGAAISRELKRAGLLVAANYAWKDDVARRFSATEDIPIFKWDVGSPDDCEAGLEQIRSQLGPIEVVVNNAAISRRSLVHEMSTADWAIVIRTNLDSVFNMIRPVLADMRARRYGRIISISSVNSQKGQPAHANYCAAKAGIIGFTKALAQEVAPYGITANVVSPGYVATDSMASITPELFHSVVLPLIPVGRIGQPDEIARCVSFLAAEEAGFITGAVLSVNGGQHMA